jgi:signal transduction histidine kinase
MNFRFDNIEEFFLNTLLRIAMAGVFLILLADAFLYPEDRVSIAIDMVILGACVAAYFMRRKYPTGAVLIFTSVILIAMIYQCLVVPTNTTTSLSIILIVGFIFSVMLKGRLLFAMHCLTVIILHSIFIYQFYHRELAFSTKVNDVVTVAITYSILYFILTYASWVLKLRYDEINKNLKSANNALRQNAHEIETRNEELLQTQNNLNELNMVLEKKVTERTAQIRAQNEMLIKYSYTNAHHLRGPVARLLGLASIYKVDPTADCIFLITKMIDEANEIDAMVKKITADLENNIN